MLSNAGKSRKEMCMTSCVNALRPPHLSEGRHLQPGQLIHQSAVEYLKKVDDPLAKCQARVFSEESRSWISVHSYLDHCQIEQDSHAKVISKIIQELETANNSRVPLSGALVHTLQGLASSGELASSLATAILCCMLMFYSCWTPIIC